MMNNAKAMTAAVLVATALVGGAATPASAADGARPLPPGAAVPFDPGYGTTWYSYDVAPLSSQSDASVRTLGRFDGDQVLCTWNKGGIQQCHVDGKDVVDFWGTPWGRVISTDPVVKAFAPVIRSFLSLATRLAIWL